MALVVAAIVILILTAIGVAVRTCIEIGVNHVAGGVSHDLVIGIHELRHKSSPLKSLDLVTSGPVLRLAENTQPPGRDFLN